MIRTPGDFQKLWFTDAAWHYVTEPEPELIVRATKRRGRPVQWPRGRVLGGSGAINSMVCVRGNRRDYDCWSYLGNSGWDYRSVLPYFKQSERFLSADGKYHGHDGPLAVGPIPSPNPASVAFVRSCEALDFPRNDDFNAEKQFGAGLASVYVEDRHRVTSASAFIHAVERDRPNLVIHTASLATRVLFDGDRATGVEYRRLDQPQLRQAFADEVIVSCGTVDSPKLLMLSGVGPAAELRRFNIPIVADLPGVGENVQDHAIAAVGYLYRDGKPSAPATAGVAEACLFLNTEERDAHGPNLQLHFAHWLLLDPQFLPAPPLTSQHGFSIIATLIRPQSRGRISLRSADAADPPVMVGNYLQCPADRDVLRDGIVLSRKIAHTGPLADFRGQEIAPGVDVRTADDIETYVRTAAGGLFHVAGSCKMGLDAMAVVGPDLAVHGVRGLRVVDASVMPTITSGNTNAPTVMIAEKGAAMIRASESVIGYS